MGSSRTGSTNSLCFIPGIQLKQDYTIKSVNSSETGSRDTLAPQYKIYFSWNAQMEALMVTPETTPEEMGGALLSIMGLTVQDVEKPLSDGTSVSITFWDYDGKQVLGQLRGNSPETPYQMKISTGTFYYSLLFTNRPSFK